MEIKHILKKQLPSRSRFILDCIGLSRELSPEINSEFFNAIENKFGTIEDLLLVKNFINHRRY